MEIESELQNLNRFYQESNGSPGILSEIKAMLKLPNEHTILPFLLENQKKTKLALQFVEKSWKVMN